MERSTFKSTLSITHIGTATAILSIDGINFLTDPFFSPANTEYVFGQHVLKNSDSPALTLDALPPIDAVLLSHEDHWDNLDDLGRRLLDGRRVLTTRDGASKLAPRPGVVGLAPWQTVDLLAGGRTFHVTGTPCVHLPGGECTGFVVECEEFGVGPDGKPNAIYFSGDTIYVEEAARGLREKWNVVVALMNLGRAKVQLPEEKLQITMDGVQAAKLFRESGAKLLIPMHFESWGHFTQFGGELKEVFKQEGLEECVHWLEPGVDTRII
ncbi:beta-lactamase superfamily domain-containing protein [Diaporthe sp. PMI_573]|nr:beta-lactamase superfamily domain-containing protein [Diaporthaceae sp. PMI_573]